MKRKSCDRITFAGSVMVCLVIGCSKSDFGQVSGTVSLNGTPVGPGTIMFEPVSPEGPQARSGVGNFSENGQYKLRSSGGREGVPPGEYYVIVDGKGGASSGDEYVDPSVKSKIPAKYSNPRVSGLKATVALGENSIDFDLKP
jgi:hypothetical protein